MPKRRASANNNNNIETKKFKQSTLDVSASMNWNEGSNLLTYKDSNFKSSSKVLALDLDGTIITTASGKVFAANVNDWKLLSPKIPSILKNYIDDGFAIVIISNQGGLAKDSDRRIPEFKTKFNAIGAKLGIPLRAYFSIFDDYLRKPRIGMWETLESDNDGIEINRNESIYCGDAAGREARGKTKKDHSHCDRLFALNVGITFRTPEELWDGNYAAYFTYPLLFDVTKFRDSFDESVDPVPSALKDLKSPVLVIMVGFPASGKSTFCSQYLQNMTFQIVSRDTIKDMKKCVEKCQDLLKSGLSVVIDNTNVDIASRSPFLKVAKNLTIPAYACVLKTSLDHARHNEIFRQITCKGHSKISSMVFNMMKNKYQAPTKEEGFTNIFEIPFIPKHSSQTHKELYFKHLLEK
nr:bifunctional polynucleotide [Hymenolepis microstoma]